VGAFTRKRVDTLRVEEAPKGESQERRRCETKPARARREKAAERVTKPCGRNVAGSANPRAVDLRILERCRDAKPMRGAVGCG
jgi:hypothetical protein